MSVHGEVTVVIPTIAGRRVLLERALASVWAQDCPPAAVVIVYDRDRRGAWWARNQGAAMARTEWIAWLDDDDELLPHHLHALAEAGEESGAGLVYGYPDFVGGPDPLAVCDDQGGLVPSPLHVPFGPRQAQWLRRVGQFIPVTYLVRTALVHQVGGMPQPFSVEWPQANEDHGFLIRLLDHAVRFHNAETVSWRYHFHAANTGGRGIVGASG
jgi:glycosyltransferase involved in cell wall biosynthesis